MNNAPRTYQEPLAITEQRQYVLQEIQKAAQTYSGMLQKILQNIYQVIQTTVPGAVCGSQLYDDTKLMLQRHLNDIKSGKASDDFPPAIPLAIKFMQNNAMVVKEIDRLEKEGKPLVVTEIKGQLSIPVVQFNDSKLESSAPASSRQVFLGEHYSTTMTKSPTIKIPGWINPALGHINV